MSINRVLISGNLTRDSDHRSTAGGTSVLAFGVAVNDRRRNPQTGEWEDYPNFVECTLFGARADSLQKYLLKGTKVAIDGKLRFSQWERDGQKRSKLEVIVDAIEFLSRNPASQSGYGQSSYNQSYSAQAPAAQNQPQQGSDYYPPNEIDNSSQPYYDESTGAADDGGFGAGEADVRIPSPPDIDNLADEEMPF